MTDAPARNHTTGQALVVGLDLGTTSVKALALDASARVVSRHEVGYPLGVSRHTAGDAGEATQDPAAVVRAAREALARLQADLPARRVRAVVPSAAMHSLVLVDRAGTPLAPALTWADTRPAATLPDLRAALDPQAAYLRTGCPVQTPYHPARLWWLARHDPALLGRAALAVSLTDLVLHDLTGAWGTSVGLASTTGLMNLRAGAWDDDLLAALGVTADLLPPILGAASPVGTVRAGAWRGVPVLAGSSDGALANLGSGAGPGETVLTVGTSGAARRLTARPVLDPLARTWTYRLDADTHLAGGAINNGGLLVDWVRGQWYTDLAPRDGFRQLLSDAERTPPGADGVTLLPYLTGERSPSWRADLTATVHGLRLGHTRAHVARAALEAVAFSLAAVHDLIRQGDPPAGEGTVSATGGLARAPVWNALLADTLGTPVRSQGAPDASAIGAALLGHGPDTLAAVRAAAAGASVIRPDPARTDALRDARGRWTALNARLNG
ncbi:gluconokinase [Deinococcus aquiradiocola]|uniref:Gluconokinase n=1 Tax=Deinococcus aquiradiocola TaxID=393059 RepID=A0A917P9I3_9DEIO|nr:gluconokinase [Deinococcus aquiradiocola]GGJ67599.1 gluconokinase [Deinococcus aquiradiocola]